MDNFLIDCLINHHLDKLNRNEDVEATLKMLYFLSLCKDK